MIYEAMGRMHAAVLQLARREEGQGTVEYVGLVLLLAGVLGAVVVASKQAGADGSIAKAVVTKLKAAIDGVGAAVPR